MSGSDDLKTQALVALDALLAGKGGGSLDVARSLLGPGSRRGLPTEQRNAANVRTREYKARQALARAPESEDVVTACGYVMLDILEQERDRSHKPLMALLIGELGAAGFDKAQSAKVLERLASGVDDRRTGWHRRLERRTMERLLAVLPATPTRHTG